MTKFATIKLATRIIVATRITNINNSLTMLKTDK